MQLFPRASRTPKTSANSGTIGGLEASIGLGGSDDRVYNSGTLAGDVYLGGGNDLIDTRHGTITGSTTFAGDSAGSVYGGDGSDTYLISDADILLIEDVGVLGDIDVVKSSASYQLESNFETLSLLGGHSINGIGNQGQNTLNGNSGDNVLSGLAGNDTLFGNAGDDRLLGGIASDRLYGGDGDDQIVGGLGRDFMYGGAGDDIFVFNSASSTGATRATGDAIWDFKPGEDLIDVSHINANTTSPYRYYFNFIGSNAFTNSAGQLHTVFSGSDTLVEFDRNGDGVSDGTIVLSGHLELTVGDFIIYPSML